MRLEDKVCIITGAAGLLGGQFSDALLAEGGDVCLLDVDNVALQIRTSELREKYGKKCFSIVSDITSEKSVSAACRKIMARHGKIDVLINNAANNPKVVGGDSASLVRFEHFRLENWEKDLAVGLSGAFICCKVFGKEMVGNKGGIIVNIASDLSVIAPDQRLYRKDHISPENQPVKPVTYSVIKTGLIGLTRYLATYWADCGIRVNALSPGGIYSGQPDEFVKRLTNLIPMGRMADIDEYREAILFLCSDASRYMTGQNLVIDGGRSIW